MKRAPKLAEVNTSEGVWTVLKKSNLLNFLFLLMPKDENTLPEIRDKMALVRAH